MSENNSKENYLLIRDLINETLLRDLILFMLLFLIVLSQSWENIFLLLYPIVTFAFSLFFKIISTNKWRIEYKDIPIIYFPLGSEKKNANRLNFSALIQLVLLFWIGAESLYHPQLIQQYSQYFVVLYIFFYSFGFYWIVIDVWKFSKIAFGLGNVDQMEIAKEGQISDSHIENVLSSLKPRKFRLISIINLSVFLSLNLLNIASVLLSNNIIILGLHYRLPGTGIEGSNPIILTYIALIVFVISPLFTVIYLILIKKDINDINYENLNQVLDSLPANIQADLIDSLKNLNKKFQKQQKME